MVTYPTHILCPVDLSETSARALAYAVSVARSYRARLTVLHVHQLLVLPLATVGPYAAPSIPVVLSDAERAQLEAALTQFAEARTTSDVTVQTSIVEDINISAAILSHAGMVGADFIVIGTEGRSGIERLMLGSVAERVLRRAICPVVTVPPHSHGEMRAQDAVREVLCPIDLSASSIAALEWAVSWGAKAGARVTALHVVEMSPEAADPALVEFAPFRERLIRDARQTIDRTVPEALRQHDRFETQVIVGRPATEILRLAAARATDLIVMGVRGRGAVDLAVFGSTTHHVIRGAMCPVLAVHPE